MFGFIVADRSTLSPQEFERYRACYCGLCAAIRRRHGELCGVTLTYDLTLLPLLLGALYQPQETQEEKRCAIHPVKKRLRWSTCFTDYAADMNVLLAYYKLMDDWQDDGDILRYGAAQCLKKACGKIESMYPRQSAAVRECLAELSAVERKGGSNPDEAAHWFGVLMGELFWLEEDEHAETLRRLGYFLGKFIYLQDASVDMYKDLKRERYNPLVFSEQTDHRPMLRLLIGDATEELEKLPLHRDERIIKNILYSGVWSKYELAQSRKEKRKEKHGG